MTATENYDTRAKTVHSLLCVGLDSNIDRLPKSFADSDTPQFDFNRAIIDATHHYVSAYKPNTAFYEARGDQGIHELKLTLDYLKQKYPDILTICDAKRADIGSTNEGYASAIFDWLGFDAVTLHPYLGKEALDPFLQRDDKVCIILARTSNPGAGEFQDLVIDGKPLWHHVSHTVANKWNQHGNCMLVVGATYPQELNAIRELVGDMTLLVPGIGAQGGSVQEAVQAGLNSQGRGMIINSSRGIIFASDGDDFAQAAGAAAKILRDKINKNRSLA